MKFLTEIDTEKYTEFVKNHKLGNMMQATEWAQIKNTWDVERVAVVDDNNNIIAATQILTKKAFGMPLVVPLWIMIIKNLYHSF